MAESNPGGAQRRGRKVRRIVNTKPIWIDQDLFAEWTKGGEVLFSKVDKSLDCYWVLARFNHDLEGQSQGSKFTLQLQRYFKIGDECMISCDAQAQEALKAAMALRVRSR